MNQESPKPPETAPANVSDIAKANIEAMPPATPGYQGEEPQIPPGEGPQRYADLTDSQGNRFDPSIHESDASGAPRLNSRGFLARKRGRKSGAAPASKLAEPRTSPEMKEAPAARGMAPREAGRHVANAFIAMNVQIGGQDFAPIKDDANGIDEQTEIQTRFGEYFASKQWRDLPPGVALAICVSGYYLARVNKPVVRTKLERAKNWIASKYLAWKARRRGGVNSASKENAQSDTRNDGKRENDARKTPMFGVSRQRN